MFELLKTDATSKARRGRLRTAHGVVDTPVFMPVGTQASVKALDNRELMEMGTQILLGNTYHLHIRPGMEIINAAGGLHRFMNWTRPILTDSGGFQVFSLAKIRKIKPNGVEFRSHVDGSALFLGPKEAMEIQRMLGSDIAMVFDECPPHDCAPKAAEEAVERTMRWAAECREQPRGAGQLVFGITQGGIHAPLRERCARALVEMGFDGYAIGGVSVGEPEHEMMKAVELTEPFLPVDQPRYAMGLGTPAQLVELVARGVDMFDCVLPTRVARNGTAFTSKGTISIKGGAVKADFRPIEEGCGCYACRNFTRAYLRHLLNVNELLGLRMLSVHNSHMYLDLMAKIRGHIEAGTFAEFRRAYEASYIPSQKILNGRVKDASKVEDVAENSQSCPDEGGRIVISLGSRNEHATNTKPQLIGDQIMTKNYTLNPYLCFDGRCEEAIEFYRKAIGAELMMLMRFKDAPPEAKAQGCGPANSENKVMHAGLRLGATTMMLSDGFCKGEPKFEGFTLSLTVTSPAEAEPLFAALSDGGKVEMPLGKTFFSPAFGVVNDRFGVKWMVYVHAPPAA